MEERIRKIITRGTWLYDDTVPCDVRIVKTNYFQEEDPYPEDELTPSIPPADPNGFWYFIEYVIDGQARSVSDCFESAHKAIAFATATLKGSIAWE